MRFGSRQKRHTTVWSFPGTKVLHFPVPQRLAKLSRRTFFRHPERSNPWVANPPMSPIPMAARDFAVANFPPRIQAVTANIEGSTIGEARQNAITAERETPMRSNAAMRGTTPHEHRGDMPPAIVASTIINPGEPLNALAISPLRPWHLFRRPSARKKAKTGQIFQESSCHE